MINIKVYIGPTVPGVAVHGTIYNNGPSKELEVAMEKEPAFRSLLVPVEKLANATAEIERKDGAAYVFYQKAMKYKA